MTTEQERTANNRTGGRSTGRPMDACMQYACFESCTMRDQTCCSDASYHDALIYNNDVLLHHVACVMCVVCVARSSADLSSRVAYSKAYKEGISSVLGCAVELPRSSAKNGMAGTVNDISHCSLCLARRISNVVDYYFSMLLCGAASTDVLKA